MTVLLLLLSVIIVLLVVIVAMMVTGWPGRERAEIEKTGNALRREMAEHRADSIQLLHSIRIEVEDAVRESIEREMAAASPRSGRSRRRRPVQDAVTDAPGQQAMMPVEEESDDGVIDASVRQRQLPLFPDIPVVATPAAVLAVEPVRVEPEPEPEPVRVEPVSHSFAFDDIPDVE